MVFNVTPEMSVLRSASGRIDSISHPLTPYFGTGLGLDAASQSPRELADQYLRDALPTFNLDQGLADGAADTLVLDRAEPTGAAEQLNFSEEKIGAQSATVSYTQTILGLPIWGAGFAVRMRGAPLGVIGSQNTIEPEIGEVHVPAPSAEFLPERIDAGRLAGLLQIEPELTISGQRLIVYRYDASERGNAIGEMEANQEAEACPTLMVSEPPAAIRSGTFYVTNEVLFAYQAPGWGPLNWRVFIEPDTGAILRLDAMVSCVDGLVLLRDPLTSSGVDTAPSSTASALDALRTPVELRELVNDGQVHRLEGPYVRVANVSAPNVAAPTAPLGGSFAHSVPTDEFAAVNGYYHCDQCFRLLEELGFDVHDYFDGTTFPVVVDHRATIGGQINTVNAQAPGTINGQGSDGFRFALLAANTGVGMAVEQRVTWHEFGHALLWDHLHSPNFRFAHSPGDAIAAILLDPTSQAPDPGRTFPWTIINRRHDHEPASGFAWGGARDDTLPVGHMLSTDRKGYGREQILSSTLFRVYRSIGGGSSDPALRQQAAHRTVWLLLEAIASLSPAAPPQTAEDLLATLIETDLHATSPVEPRTAGLFSKVLRWSFERQGLFQGPAAPTPVTAPGRPPAVDIYIDDGRLGSYAETPVVILEPPALRVRLQQDGGAANEIPQAGATAFVYATVSNRGDTVATGVGMRVFVAPANDADVFSGGWVALEPLAGLETPFTVAAGQMVTVGPFRWPTEAGDWLILAEVDSADDPSLRSTLSGICPASTLAMMDNNVATRRIVV